MEISDFFTQDHRRCDRYFADLERDAQHGRWPQISEDLRIFVTAMTRHFEIEEQLMFPALIAANPMWSPPTEVMRQEHEEMRALFDELAQAAEARDAGTLLGVAETLLFIMQSHNVKEENVLYRMADSALGHRSADLMKRIEEESDGASA